MSKYMGKLCPYCKTPFKEQDEIVTCSACDMPHHKDCWIENQGCSTFGCMGTIKGINESTEMVMSKERAPENGSATTQYEYCIHCGAPNMSGNSFCGKCGSRLQNIQNRELLYQNYNNSGYEHSGMYANNDYNQNSYYGKANTGDSLPGEVEMYVRKKPEYYLPKFQKLKMTHKQTSWNWCAALASPYWFIYRKMYGYGFGILGIVFFSVIIESLFLDIMLLTGYIVLGVYGNYIYMLHIEKLIRQGNYLQGDVKDRFVQRHAGVSPLAVIGTLIGYMFLLLLFS